MKNYKNIASGIEKFAEDLTASIKSLEAEKAEAKEKALNAETAYFEDLNTRKNNLKKQEELYEAELDKLRTDRRKTVAAVTEATSRGDIERAASFDERLESLDGNIGRVERKIEFMQETELAKNKILYDSANEAQEVFQKAKAEYATNLTEIENACKAFERINKLIDDRLFSNQYDRTNAAAVERDYTARPAKNDTQKEAKPDDEPKSKRQVTVIAPPDFKAIREKELEHIKVAEEAQKTEPVKRTVHVLTEKGIKKMNEKHGVI